MADKKPICLIIEESVSVSRDELAHVAKKWKYKPSEIKEQEEWVFGSQYTSFSLFGEKFLIHLNLMDKDNMKAFSKLLDKEKDKFTGDWLGAASLVITVSTATCKKIQEFVKASGGYIRAKKKPETVRDDLLKKINIDESIKAALREFVGDDYEMLISFVNETSQLPTEEQRGMSADQVFMALPQKPGAIKPWEFIKPLMVGNLAATKEAYERTVINTHVLVLMLFAKRKLDLVYRVRMCIEEGVKRSEEIAPKLGIRNGPELWDAIKCANRISIPTAEFIARHTLDTENNIKGGRNVDPIGQFGVYLSTVCLAITYNRPLNT